jgi:hypothetical protein
MNWSDFWVGLGQILAGVAMGIIAIWIKNLKSYLSKKSIKRSIRENMMIKQILAEIRSYCDADRVQLYQFHNGDHYISGGSIQKASMSHFVLNRGVGVPFESNHQNIPIGYILSAMDDVLKNSSAFYTEEELLQDSFMKGLLRHGGAKSALLRGIFSANHDMIGFLSISWFDPVDFSIEQQKAVKDLSLQLSDEMLLGAKTD